MDIWFANADKLRTGEATTACVSCHTSVPYFMARPALRRAMQVSNATPQEIRLLQEATQRVQTYGAHQLLYEFNESKKVESRGTEAVLNAFVLATADATENRLEPSAATRLALERLWEIQRPDGAWDWLNFGLEPFESVDARYYGATVAAMAIGMAPGLSNRQAPQAAMGIERLYGFLKENYTSQSLYNRIWTLLASTRLKDSLTTEQRETLIAEIQSRQREDGGWALEALGAWRWSQPAAPFRAPGALDASLLAQSDGYATGLVVYTLRQAGLAGSQPAVRKGLQWLRTNQRSFQVNEHTWLAWRAHSLNFDREHGGPKGEPWRRMFMSDSATAFAVLALASE
jgi:squalene-hopene/tetraprenyl-beta-curcumene cyclase